LAGRRREKLKLSKASSCNGGFANIVLPPPLADPGLKTASLNKNGELCVSKRTAMIVATF